MAKLVYAEPDRAASIVTAEKCAFDASLAPIVEAAAEEARAFISAGDDAAAIQTLSTLAVETGKEALDRWTKLWPKLMVANADGYSAVANPNDLMCGCNKTAATFDAAWLAKVRAV